MAPGNVQGTFAESIVSMRPVVFNKSKYFGKHKTAGRGSRKLKPTNSRQPQLVTTTSGFPQQMFLNRLLVESYGFKRSGLGLTQRRLVNTLGSEMCWTVKKPDIFERMVSMQVTSEMDVNVTSCCLTCPGPSSTNMFICMWVC